MDGGSRDFPFASIELGAAIVGLAILARISKRWGFSAIPLYLIAGLFFGNGGLWPLDLTKDFIHMGTEIGVLLLLFMLGLEYTGQELKANLRAGLFAGVLHCNCRFGSRHGRVHRTDGRHVRAFSGAARHGSPQNYQVVLPLKRTYY